MLKSVKIAVFFLKSVKIVSNFPEMVNNLKQPTPKLDPFSIYFYSINNTPPKRNLVGVFQLVADGNAFCDGGEFDVHW